MSEIEYKQLEQDDLELPPKSKKLKRCYYTFDLCLKFTLVILGIYIASMAYIISLHSSNISRTANNLNNFSKQGENLTNRLDNHLDLIFSTFVKLNNATDIADDVMNQMKNILPVLGIILDGVEPCATYASQYCQNGEN